MKVINFFKKPIVIFFLIVAVAAVVGGFYYSSREEVVTYDFVEAQRGELVQEVSVTGNVKPSESVDLAFEVSGKIAKVEAQVGDKVIIDQLLISLDGSGLNAELSKATANVSSARAQLASTKASLESSQAKLLEAQASIDAEQVKLNELKLGTRTEEIKIAETKVANAEKDLTDAQTNLTNVESKAEADLQEDYNAALTAVQQAVSKGKTAILVLTDIQYTRFTSNDQSSIALADAKAVAIEALLGAQGAGHWSRYAISSLEGGAFGTVMDAVDSPTFENIDQAILETNSALQKIRDALDSVPTTGVLTSTEQANLTTEKTNINTEVTTVSGKKQAISVQKATNESSIATAQANINNAQNALDSAEDELALKKAGYTAEQIAVQEAKVKQAQAGLSSQQALKRKAEADVTSQEAAVRQALANVENYRAQIEKTILRAPIVGIVTKQEGKVGEIIAASATIISIISENEFEIEVNVAEVDIASLKIGNKAEVTLDAYGIDVGYTATIVEIDPAETVIEGVPTYKVVLQFEQENGTIKSGMTANIDILAEKKENVINVPQRAVLREAGKKIVRIINPDNSFRKVEVITGLRGSDGNIEIISGVNEGDKVIISIIEK